ncbi:MAG: AAA family ATPase [Steroidobacteraceae bacterium]
MVLEYAIQSGLGFALITGEVGSGKTILVRQLLDQYNDTIRVALVNASRQVRRNLLQWVCAACDIDTQDASAADSHSRFNDYLVSQYAGGKRVVLVVDEAQNLGGRGLEELRILSNINADKHLVLQTFLVGQPELRTLLQRARLRQFAQRISVDYHISALSAEETVDYVRHRLQIAGGSDHFISRDAILVAYERVGGIPRLINMLCDLALVYGMADGITSIGIETMQEALRDRSAGGMLPGPAVVKPAISQLRA